MVAWMRTAVNDEATTDDEVGRSRSAVKPEPDAKLEDAVQRAMNDLEQEKRGAADTNRSRRSAS